jgi:hypothetical protein
MSEIDTSAEAVERLAREHDLVRFTLSMKSPQHDKTAATLRALLAERDAARHALRVIYPYLDALPDRLRGQAECEVRRGRGDTP